MKIEKNKIRLLFYICTISIVSILIIVQSTIFIESSKEQSRQKIDQIVDNIYAMKKLYIKDVVNSTIQDIEIERKLVSKQSQDILKDLSNNIKDLVDEGYDLDRIIEALSDFKFSLLNVDIAIYSIEDRFIDYKYIEESKINMPLNIEDFNNALESKFLYEKLRLENYEIYLMIEKEKIESIVRKNMSIHIRDKRYFDDGYVWINKVINYEGGDDYAIRLIHPNLVDTEGMLLSTEITDIGGGKPYELELEGVKKDGEIFYEYYFKKLNSDKIERKLSYARLYEPYDWIVANGIYMDDLEDAIEREKEEIKAFEKNLLLKISLLNILCLICSIVLIIFFERLITRWVVRFQEIVNEKNREILREKKMIEEIAYLDPLTSLLNRRAMNKELKKSFNLACCNKETFSVIIGDIDFFKRINDKYGHIAGDMVIKKIADILSDNIKSYDYVSRWGGEEFLILLNYCNTDEALGVLNRIIDLIRDTDIIFENEPISCTLSFGLASYSHSFSSVDELIKKADKNLYDAKISGRNKIVY